MTRTRMTPTDRQQAIIDAALRVAKRKGLANVTKVEVATEAGCAQGLVSHYFTMPDLLDAAVRQAVRDRELKVIAAAIVLKHRGLGRISPALRAEALAAAGGGK